MRLSGRKQLSWSTDGALCFVIVNAGGDVMMDMSPTSPDVERSLAMVIGSQSFRDEVQTVIAQQMKLDSLPTAVPYAARGLALSFRLEL